MSEARKSWYVKKPRFKWSFNYKACITCKKTKRPYAGKGMCKLCYGKHYYKTVTKQNYVWKT